MVGIAFYLADETKCDLLDAYQSLSLVLFHVFLFAHVSYQHSVFLVPCLRRKHVSSMHFCRLFSREGGGTYMERHFLPHRQFFVVLLVANFAILNRWSCDAVLISAIDDAIMRCSFAFRNRQSMMRLCFSRLVTLRYVQFCLLQSPNPRCSIVFAFRW